MEKILSAKDSRLLIVFLIPIIVTIVVAYRTNHSQLISDVGSDNQYIEMSDFRIFLANILNFATENLNYNLCLVNDTVVNGQVVAPRFDTITGTIGPISTTSVSNLNRFFPKLGSIDLYLYFSNGKNKELHSLVGEKKCLVVRGSDFNSVQAKIGMYQLPKSFNLESTPFANSNKGVVFYPQKDLRNSRLNGSLTFFSSIIVLIFFSLAWCGLIVLTRETVNFIQKGFD